MVRGIFCPLPFLLPTPNIHIFSLFLSGKRCCLAIPTSWTPPVLNGGALPGHPVATICFGDGHLNLTDGQVTLVPFPCSASQATPRVSPPVIRSGGISIQASFFSGRYFQPRPCPPRGQPSCRSWRRVSPFQLGCLAGYPTKSDRSPWLPETSQALFQKGLTAITSPFFCWRLLGWSRAERPSVSWTKVSKTLWSNPPVWLYVNLCGVRRRSLELSVSSRIEVFPPDRWPPRKRRASMKPECESRCQISNFLSSYHVRSKASNVCGLVKKKPHWLKAHQANKNSVFCADFFPQLDYVFFFVCSYASACSPRYLATFVCFWFVLGAFGVFGFLVSLLFCCQ